MIQFYSTNGLAPLATFEEALFRGLAPDGGLYFPQQFPRFSAETIAQLPGATLIEVGEAVLNAWFAAEITPEEIAKIASSALSFPIPLIPVGDFHILELFHGPTMAFKDVAARTLSRLMSHFLQKSHQRITLLVATSGDTGGAIAHGFSDVEGIDVYVLFPKGRVSALQEEQLTRVADNITPIEVEGVFDDCQAMVKQAFNDPALQSLNLTSANSISIGRLIPQIIYYISAYAQAPRPNWQFIVPSGNFGNLTGGLFARAMGLPFDSFIAATNLNDSVVRYLQTGRYQPYQTVQTLSNAMDVGNPSNFARILELYQGEHNTIRTLISAHAISDRETVETMRRVYDQYGYLLDPHTAVGWRVAEQFGAEDRPKIITATAAPIKFAQEIALATGIVVDDSAEIAKLHQRPQRKQTIPNDYHALTQLLLHQ